MIRGRGDSNPGRKEKREVKKGRWKRGKKGKKYTIWTNPREELGY